MKTTSQIEKPRYIIFALQTNKRNLLKGNPTNFDHCDVTNAKAYYNSDAYPCEDLNLTYDKSNYSLLHSMYYDFQKTYYNRLVAERLLSRGAFKSQGTIFIIDCRHQSEIIKNGPVDFRIEIKTSKIIPAYTSAYCLMLHDRIVNYNPLSQIVSREI